MKKSAILFLLFAGCGLMTSTSQKEDLVFEDDPHLVFDGDGDYVEVADPADETLDFELDAFTISFWLKTEMRGDGQILCKRPVSGEGNGYELQVGDDGLVSFNNGLGVEAATDGAWHHILYVHDGADHELYLDGRLANSKPWSWLAGEVASVSSNGPLKFGADSVDGEYYEGALDEIALWRARLNSKAATQIYEGGRTLDLMQNVGSYTFSESLAGYWKFDEQEGSIAEDATAHGNHGDIVGATREDG